MTILISIIVILLISFWFLGYTYQYYSSQGAVKLRKAREREKKIKRKIEALEKEKKLYMKKIEELTEEIKKIQERLNEIEKMKNISL